MNNDIAYISKPCRSAMQSGNRKNKKWIIQFKSDKLGIDHLMGWSSSTSTKHHVNGSLIFDSLNDAINFCEKNSYKYEIKNESTIKHIIKDYTDNFRS